MTDVKGNVVPAWKIFWGTFGASNQLLVQLKACNLSIFFESGPGGEKLPALYLGQDVHLNQSQFIFS
jgi:hypothetical protein